jgi:hypothetical protein
MWGATVIARDAAAILLLGVNYGDEVTPLCVQH